MAAVHHRRFVVCAWTTNKEHLVEQHLVGIGCLVLKIGLCEFQYYWSLAWKCLFMPLLGNLGV